MNKGFWENYLRRVISGDETGLVAMIIRLLLSILELVYLGILKISIISHRRRRLPVPVISVGNIAIGGTGKTPTVVWLAKLFIANGYKPAILTRGYLGKYQAEGLAFQDTDLAKYSAADTGDEPFLLAGLLPGTPIVAGRERYRNGLAALQKYPEIDLFILDDGFQHWNLARDLDLVIIDATQPFNNGHLLPRGFLREPISSLKRAGVILLTRSSRVDAERLDTLKQKILKINRQALITPVKEAPAFLDSLPGLPNPEKIPAAQFLAGRKVSAVTGIGNPRQFLASLENMGAEVGYFKAYPDHYRWDRIEIESLIKGLAENGFSELIITAKDGVKIEPFQSLFWENGLKCYILSMEFLIEDQSIIEKVITTIKPGSP